MGDRDQEKMGASSKTERRPISASRASMVSRTSGSNVSASKILMLKEQREQLEQVYSAFTFGVGVVDTWHGSTDCTYTYRLKQKKRESVRKMIELRKRRENSKKQRKSARGLKHWVCINASFSSN